MRGELRNNNHSEINSTTRGLVNDLVRQVDKFLKKLKKDNKKEKERMSKYGSNAKAELEAIQAVDDVIDELEGEVNKRWL